MTSYACEMGNMTGMGVWMVLWTLVGLAAIAAVVLAVVWLARSQISPRPSTDAARPDEALQVLRRRYAAGDIDQEQYQTQLRDLQIR